MDQEIKNQLDRLEQKLDVIIKHFRIQEESDLSHREVEAITDAIIQEALNGKKNRFGSILKFLARPKQWPGFLLPFQKVVQKLHKYNV